MRQPARRHVTDRASCLQAHAGVDANSHLGLPAMFLCGPVKPASVNQRKRTMGSVADNIARKVLSSRGSKIVDLVGWREGRKMVREGGVGGEDLVPPRSWTSIPATACSRDGRMKSIRTGQTGIRLPFDRIRLHREGGQDGNIANREVGFRVYGPLSVEACRQFSGGQRTRRGVCSRATVPCRAPPRSLPDRELEGANSMPARAILEP